jgi:hypothetical protein
MDSEGKAIIAVGPADYRTAVMKVGPEKHNIPVIVFNNPGVMNSSHRVGNIFFG